MIRKPHESDKDYECDATGHYRLAIQDLVYRLTTEQRERAWEWAQTPLGGYRPLPNARKFHRSRKRFRHCLGGNRSSKSHSLAVETMWRAMGMHPFREDVKAPSVGWYATTTFEKVADTLWEKLDPAKGGLLLGIEVLGYRWDIVWRSKQLGIPNKATIRLPGNKGTSEIWFKAYEQGRESFQAVALDYAHFDEQYSEPIFIETTSRIGPGRKMEFADALTPLNPSPWLEKRTSIEVPATDDVFYFPLDDNRTEWGGFIDGQLIDATIENWPPEARDTRRLGRWGSYVGQIFKSFDRAAHVVSAEKEKRCCFLAQRAMPLAIGGLDWGGSNPFCFLWACRLPHLDNDWYVFDELYWRYRDKGGRRLAELADDIRKQTEQWKTRLARVWADHDPTNAYEFQHAGVQTMPARKVGDADEISRAGIEDIQSLLNPREHLSNADWPKGRPRLHIAERCKNLIHEMQMYRWAEVADPTKRDPRDQPVKVDDHAVDALRYLIHSEKPFEGTGAMPDIGTYARTFR